MPKIRILNKIARRILRHLRATVGVLKNKGKSMRMYYSILFLALLSLSTMLSAFSIRTPPVDIDIGPYGYYYEDPYYHIWSGPGWYYGRYFNDEYEYYNWLNNNFYGVSWDGPGWYYGIYFDTRGDFYRYRSRHRIYSYRYRQRYDSKHDSLHRSERRGRWAKRKNNRD